MRRSLPLLAFAAPRRPRKLVTVLAIAAFAVVLAAQAGPAIAQTPVTWQMATEYPQSNISGVGLSTFARLVSVGTGGRVTVTVAYDNELKITSGEMPRAVQDNHLTGGDAFAAPLAAIDPLFGLPSLPFVVQSVATAQAVNTQARPLYEKALQARGLKLLYLTIWPSTGIWSDRPLAAPDDLRQLSIRTYDAASAEVMRAAGAKAELMPFNEAIAAVKEQRLNAILTSGDGGAGRKLWDHLRHFTPVNYAIPISLAFVRSQALDALPEDLRKQVMEAAAETERSQFALLANRTTENYANMRANGVIIAETAPAAVVAVLRQAASDPLAAWKARVTGEAIAIVDWANKQ